LISADGTRRVPVAVSVRAYGLVANRACRSAVAVTVGANVLATDPARRVAVSIGVGVDRAAVLSPARIARSICVRVFWAYSGRTEMASTSDVRMRRAIDRPFAVSEQLR
jgi:hypothetical protein